MEYKAQNASRQSIQERLEQIESQQKAQSRRTAFLLFAVLAVIIAAVLLTAPRIHGMVQRYDSAMDAVEEMGQAVGALDPEALSRAMEQLSSLDPAALDEALGFLRDIDAAQLRKDLEEMQGVLDTLSDLDIEAVNETIHNLNAALQPFMRLFGSN